MRSASRKVREVAEEGDETVTAEALGEAYSALDRAAKTGAIHKRQADRRKRRLAAFVRRTEA